MRRGQNGVFPLRAGGARRTGADPRDTGTQDRSRRSDRIGSAVVRLACRRNCAGDCDAYSSQPIDADQYGRIKKSRMSEQEAFGWVVRVVRLGDWSPAIPEQPKLEVAGQLLTIHEICEREQNQHVPLPQAVADDSICPF